MGHAQTQLRREVFPAPMWRPVFPVVLGGHVVGRVTVVGPDVEGAPSTLRSGAFTLAATVVPEDWTRSRPLSCRAPD
ncbi:hypothetical protein ACFWP7_05320 [Streptomyces sp. NPDC058470]|uniref:hypothetical protein n=1 Tax=Streptomyces sp. NPDC058470 TaxID=3346515 RepID=UPI003667C0B5